MTTPLQIASHPARNIRKTPRVRASDLPKGSVRQPSDPGYRGRYGDDRRKQQQWERRLRVGRTDPHEGNQLADEYSDFNRKWGRVGLAGGGVLAAAGAGGGIALNRAGERKAGKIRGVAKAIKLDPLDPVIRHATTRGGVHNVTSMPKHPRAERLKERVLGAERRISERVGNGHSGTAIASGYALGMAGVAVGAQSGGKKMDAARAERRARLRSQRLAKSSAGTEFKRGDTYERYAGEHTRGRVQTEGAAFGGVAAAGAAGATSLSSAKLAGTPLGQAALTAGEKKLRLSAKATPQLSHAADQVSRYQRYGAWAGKNRLKATGGILAAGGVAGVARIGQRARQNEEAGISQGVGRMKAGEHYSGVRQRAVVGKSVLHQTALATDILTHPKIGPLARKAYDNRGKLTAAGVGVAGTGALITSARVGQKHGREHRKLRGELRPVEKSAAALLHGGRGWAISAGATGAAGLGGAEAARRKGKQEASENLVASTVGGWAGQGAYQGATYGLKHSAIRAERKAGLTRAQKDKNLKPAKKEHGAFTTDMYRNYPKTKLDGKTPMPGWRQNRTAGWVGRGKLGNALGTAATAGGTLAGMRYVNEPKRGGTGKKQVVGKSLYVRDRQTSMTGLATTGAGLALGAWGLGRSGMIGRALSMGVKQATRRQNPYALTALQTAQAAQGVLRHGTAPGERALRQIRAVDRAVSRVPSAIRPEIALAAGTLLVGHSRPIRRDTYHPVNIRVRTAGGF